MQIGNTKITSEIVHKISFWFLSIFLIGFVAGMFFADKMIIERRLRDSVRVGGIVLYDKVYNLQERL